MPSHRVRTIPFDVVDNEQMSRAATNARQNSAASRAALGLPERCFLFVGLLAPHKNVTGLLAAYSLYRQMVKRKVWGLVVVGDGPQTGELRELQCALNLRGVLWAGPRTSAELAAYYGLATVFVLPSTRDTWGLVVNEAMACGLPVLVSARCGCSPELVEPGRNGFVFSPASTGDLAGLFARMSSGSVDLDAMGAHSQEIVGRWCLSAYASQMAAFLHDVCEDR